MIYTAPTPAVASIDNISAGTPPIPRSPHASNSNSIPPASNDSPVNTRWTGHVSQTVARHKGLLLVAASQFFFSIVNMVVKKLNSIDPPVPVLELIVVRMGTTLICCITYMFIAKIPDPFLGPKGVRVLLLIRGFCGFFGLFGVYYSLQYLSLSDATVLTFLSPLTTAIAGALLLNETFTWPQAFSGVFSLIGVILIARPTFIFGNAAAVVPSPSAGDIEKGTPAERLGAVGVALIGVLGATGTYITLRAIGKCAHPLHSLVAFSSLCVIMASIGMSIERTTINVPTSLDILLFAAIGVFGVVAQTLLVMGLQRETAGRGVLGVYLQIVFATILERMFFHSTPSILSVIGGFIILVSAICVALTKSNKPDLPDAGITTTERAEDIEEVAGMERGLLEGVDRSVSYTRL